MQSLGFLDILNYKYYNMNLILKLNNINILNIFKMSFYWDFL